MLAGDIESNPGPYTDYVGKDLCVVIMHVPTSSYLLARNYLMWFVQYIFITNLMPKIIANHNFAMPLLTYVTTATCDKIRKDVGSNPGPYGKNCCDINLEPIGI